MILSDKDIREEISSGNIVITPFKEDRLDTNSYTLSLGNILLKVLPYNHVNPEKRVDYIDFKDNKVVYEEITIPQDGYILDMNDFYLGVTEEYTETKDLVPLISGKSSVARNALMVETANLGSCGFKGKWTLELKPIFFRVKVYPGMPIAQIYYARISSPPSENYYDSVNSKYNNSKMDKKPIKSLFSF